MPLLCVLKCNYYVIYLPLFICLPVYTSVRVSLRLRDPPVVKSLAWESPRLYFSFESLQIDIVWTMVWVKSDFLKLSPPWVAREFLFARRNLVLALTPLFLGQFGQTKVLRTPKIMLFPVISGFLPKSESKWGLSRANTTPRDKRG